MFLKIAIRAALMLVPLASGYADQLSEAPKILLYVSSRVSVAAFHEGQLTVERTFQHPGISSIVGADIADGVAVLLSLDPQQGGIMGGVRAQFLNLQTGKRERVIFDERRSVRGAGVSPDGGRLALSFCDGPDRCWIDIEDLSTGERRTVLRNVANKSTIRWSPDGNRIAYIADDGTISIFEPASGRNTRIVKARYPAWSPDGRKLAFAAGHEIRVIDLSDLSQEILHREPDWMSNPLAATFTSWSPDGRYITFNAPGALPYEIACKIIDLSANSVKQISNGLSLFCGPWLPQSR
jgi:Tol biopolymer transport system component